MRGGQDDDPRTTGGCSTATVRWIAIPPGGSAASVLCGRHSGQSRHGTVAAQLSACVQRAGQDAHARVRTRSADCHPGRGANGAGARAATASAVKSATTGTFSIRRRARLRSGQNART